MRSIAVEYRLSYRAHLIGALAAAALIVAARAAFAAPAQVPPHKARIFAGIDESVKALDAVPNLKELSPEAKRQLVEFVTGNTLFVVAHALPPPARSRPTFSADSLTRRESQ
jgi:hypothetical protein